MTVQYQVDEITQAVEDAYTSVQPQMPDFADFRIDKCGEHFYNGWDAWILQFEDKNGSTFTYSIYLNPERTYLTMDGTLPILNQVNGKPSMALPEVQLELQTLIEQHIEMAVV